MAKSKNPFQVLISFLPRPIRNRYVLSVIVFAFILIFIDKNRLPKQFQLYKTEQELIDKKDFYENGLSNMKAERNELSSNPKVLEKFAREQYFMKKKNEDVFIIKEAGEISD